VISRRLFKNAHMHVELCEIPLAGALQILKMDVFQQPVYVSPYLRDPL
jgi:hypothetical protein